LLSADCSALKRDRRSFWTPTGRRGFAKKAAPPVFPWFPSFLGAPKTAKVELNKGGFMADKLNLIVLMAFYHSFAPCPNSRPTDYAKQVVPFESVQIEVIKNEKISDSKKGLKLLAFVKTGMTEKQVAKIFGRENLGYISYSPGFQQQDYFWPSFRVIVSFDTIRERVIAKTFLPLKE
jgi:hypothetical protein